MGSHSSTSCQDLDEWKHLKMEVPNSLLTAGQTLSEISVGGTLTRAVGNIWSGIESVTQQQARGLIWPHSGDG